MALSCSAEGLRVVGVSTYEWLRLVTQAEPPDYTESPGAVDPGPNPGRDEATQDGIWSSDAKLILGQLEAEQAAASELPLTSAPTSAPPNYDPMNPMYEEAQHESMAPAPHEPDSAESATTAPQGGHGTIGGGPPLPWESAFPGGGSNSVSALVNSNTGNRYTSIPLFNLPVRGGLNLGVSLNHNSKAAFQGPFGDKWSSNFEARLSRQNPHGALGNGNIIALRWGNGQTIPYVYNNNKTPAGWYPPDGIYGFITVGGTTHAEVYTLTTKHRIKYEFSHPDPGDSTFCGQAVLTKIIGRNVANTVTISRELESGRLKLITGPNGHTISFGYQQSPIRLKEVRDCLQGVNRKWTLQYDGNGRLWKLKSPALDGVDHERVFTYDSRGNVVSETDHKGKVWTCTYDGTDRQTNFMEPGVVMAPPYTGYNFIYNSTWSSMTDPLGRISKDYYSNGKIWSVMDEAGFYETYNWDSVRRVQSSRSKRGHWTTYNLDVNGNVTTATSPTGEKSYATYNADSEMVSSYGDLSPSTLGYEYTHGVTSRVFRDYPGGTADQNLMTANVSGTTGQVTNATTYDGSTSRPYSFTYDAYGNAATVLDPRSRTSYVTGNIMGWVTSAKNQLLHETTVAYDNWGRPVTITQPGGSTTVQVQYDSEGNVTQAIDERGKVHSWVYDDRGLVSSYTNAKSETEDYFYTPSGFLYRIDNGRDKTRTYTPTLRDEVKRLDMPDGSKELWQYDANGNLSAYWGAYGSGEQWTTYYGYDASDRPLLVNYPPGTPDVSFSYANYGHTVNMTDGSGTSTWIYDSWGNLTSFASPQGAPLTYQYNCLGERTRMTDPGNGDTVFQYDNFGRLSQLTNWLNEVTTWTYDDAGRMTKRTLGNGTWEDVAYDNRSRPTSITLKKPGPVTLRAQSYTYDAASNVLSHTLAGVTTAYEYDNINQLTREYKGPSGAPTWQITYGYDANGNRTHRNILGGPQETYAVDDGDKLTSVTWGGGSKSFTYDAAGRRKTQTVGGSTTTYNWDHESRLISTTGAVVSSYAYNGLDSRITKTDSGGTRNYRRDDAYVTDPVLGDNQATYTPGISERRSGTSRYLHSGIKNADSRTTTQAVEATREYDAFGNVIGSSGTWQGPFGNAAGFGYQEDTDTGLKLLGHRYYDSSIGGFISRDPVSSGRGDYQYASNNPMRWVDPTGLFSEAVYRALKKGLGDSVAEKYKTNQDYQRQIHDEMQKKKKDKVKKAKGKDKQVNNPDLTEEEIIEAGKSLEERRKKDAGERKIVSGPPPGRQSHSPASPPLRLPTRMPHNRPAQVDWGMVGLVAGLVIVGGVIIIVSGGTLAPGVAAGGVIIVGGAAARKTPGAGNAGG